MPISGSKLTGRVIFWLILVIPLPVYATVWARVHPAVYIEHSSLALYLTDIPLFFLALLWVKPQVALTRPSQALLIPLTCLLVLALTSIQVAPDPILASFFALRLAWLLGLWWVLLTYPPEPQLVHKGVALALVWQGVAAVAQFVRQDDLGWRWLGEIDVNRYPGGGSILTLGEQFWLRAYGFTPHPNILGGYLVVLLLLLIPAWLIASRSAKIWGGIALWWGVLGLFFSFSRSAWLGGSLGLGLMVMAILGRAEWRKMYTRPLFFLGLAAGFTFLGVGWWQQELVLSRFAPPPTQWQTEVRSIDERQALIEAAGELIQTSPVWGVGAGNFALAMSQSWHPRPGVSVQSVHHVPLLLAAELGILGGLIWLWLMVWPIAYACYSWWHGQLTLWGLGLTAALLAFAVIDLFDYYAWTWVQGQRLRWLLWVLWSAEVGKEVKSKNFPLSTFHFPLSTFYFLLSTCPMNYTISYPSRRSNVMAKNGLVATSQPLAAQAGLEILQQGGNAIDAAVATVATLCVVEPCSTGIGGDSFALIWSAKEQKLYGLNASGPAPAGLTSAYVRGLGHQEFPALGALPVTVPGSLRGWQLALEKFGTKGLDTLLKRPIQYAQNGFPVSERIARSWGFSVEKMSVHPDSKRVWLPSGRAPRPGELFANPQFATTLQTIASQGFEPFYRGDIGRKIVACVQEAGGLLTLEDLANYQAEWIEPLAADYHNGYTFHEIPPNGQGLTALLALNIIKGFDVQSLGRGTAEYTHLLMEAIKLAFADAEAYIADPKHAPIPLTGLLSESYSQTRRNLIDFARALPPQVGQPPAPSDTVYLTVADGEGNMVSWIQSLYMGFGSGLTAGDTGIQLQNRGANFSLVEGHPNEAAGGKRPYNTIIPGFITRHGQAWCSFGVMGGFMQPQGHVQVGLHLVDFGLSPQAALDAPRFNWLKGLEFGLENGFSDEVYQQLAQRGHQLLPRDKAMIPHYGGGQVIVRDPETGVLIGGSEPRSDGAAVGF